MWENIVIFQSGILSFIYIEIFQCEYKFMIFLQRFTVPNVSITAYTGFDEAYGTNAGFSMGANLMLTRRYDLLVILIQEMSNDVMHLGFWNIEPSCIIITRVTLSGHIIIIYNIISQFFRGVHLTKCQPDSKSHFGGFICHPMSLHPLSIPSIPRQKICKKYQY